MLTKLFNTPQLSIYSSTQSTVHWSLHITTYNLILLISGVIFPVLPVSVQACPTIPPTCHVLIRYSVTVILC